MSPIGRAFIILNLILAAVFVGYVGFYLQNVDSWKAKYEAKDKEMLAMQEAMQGTIDTLQSGKDAAENDLSRAEGEVRQKDVQIRAAEENNNELKNRLGQLESDVKSSTSSLSTIAERLENQNKRIVEMTDKFLAAEKEKEEAVTDRQDMQDRLNIAQGDLSKAQELIESLRAEIFGKAEDLRRQATELAAVMKVYPDAREIIMNGQPRIDATVLAVNTDLKTVQLSVGSESSDIKAGYTFAIHDGIYYKGDVQVTDVDKKSAMCRIISNVPGKAFVKGDKATTQLN